MVNPLPQPSNWSLDDLRGKWGEVPAGESRFRTSALATLADEALLSFWQSQRSGASTGSAFSVRGWYYELYRDFMRGKAVLDVGSGLGLDAITFAQAGARVTCADIVQENLSVVKRVARLLDVSDRVETRFLQDLRSFDELPEFDVVWAQGSLINAPAEFTRREIQRIVSHLRVGGRWIELAYPRSRWQRDGSPPFERWGVMTDGPGTPWVEWYDLGKLQAALAPAAFEPVLTMEFHDADFIWFDLVRRA